MNRWILGTLGALITQVSASAADPPVINGITFKPASVVENSPASTPIGTLDVQTTGTTVKPTVKYYTDQSLCTLPASQPPATVKLTKSLKAGNYACTFIAALSGAVGSPFIQTVVFNVKPGVVPPPPPPPDNTVGLLSHPNGSNYFAKPDGTRVLLVGSHTWPNMQNQGGAFPPPTFDWSAYIRWAEGNKFNFVRLWTDETTLQAFNGMPRYNDPMPYARTGPGVALDGKPKFDVSKFNPAYFDRLRAHAVEAGQHGMYVGVMLWNGWSIGSKAGFHDNPWPYHPYNPANNINGINGDPSNNGSGFAIETTSEPTAVLAAQQAYVQHVIDTVGGLDNVLFEITNEPETNSVTWQYNMINYIKNYEAGKPKKHPVGMTMTGPDNNPLLNSPADWISPSGSPVQADGTKVIMYDTDHIFGVGGTFSNAVQAFVRGENPIMMEDLKGAGVAGSLTLDPPADPSAYTFRQGMTVAANYAKRVDLKTFKSNNTVAPNDYAASDTDHVFIFHDGNGGTISLNLPSGNTYKAEWTDISGTTTAGTDIVGGPNLSVSSPFASSPAVLFLSKSGTAPPPVIYPDGSVLVNGAAGTLVTGTPPGKWTFGKLISPGVWHLLLNGSEVGFGTAKIEVCFGGQLCALGYDGVSWWTVTGASQWAPSADPNGSPPPPPPPPPPSPNPTPSGNVIPINNTSGTPIQKYPFSIGRPFVCGEIAHYPQAVLNGTPLQTQVDVKNRCPDNSVKFAVISAVLSSLPVDVAQNLTFQDQPTGNNASVTTADLLAQFPDFDATMELTRPASITGNIETSAATWLAIKDATLSLAVDGTTYTIGPLDISTQPSVGYAVSWISYALRAKAPVTFGASATQAFLSGGKTLSLAKPASGTDVGPLLFKSAVTTAPPSAIGSVSARKMLTDGNCKPWTSGPVEVVLQCRDRSVARVYDLDPTGKGWSPAHPEFELAFWLQNKQAQIRYTLENTNAEALETFTANVKLTAGKASPTVVYQQDTVPHSIRTRWTKTVWVGGTPEPKVNIDHNIGYLSDTGYLWNYDRSVRIPESVLSAAYSQWQGSDHSHIFSPGLWDLGMPNTGYHPEIGPMPVWYNRAVYSGDWRMREVMLGQADLVGGFGMQTREGDPARFTTRAKTTSALGLPVTQYVRPYYKSADRIVVRSPTDINSYSEDLFNGNGWEADTAHQPDPFSVPYMLTGDPYYLDGLQLWAATDTGSAEGPYVINEEAGQSRAQAWVFRTIVNAWGLSPDADPMRAAFHDAMDDTFAGWEGERGITGTKYQGTVPWTIMNQRIGIQDVWVNLGPSPLHFWNYSGDPSEVRLGIFNPAVFERANADWATNFLFYPMSHAVEMGFDGAKPTLLWLGQHLVEEISNPSSNLGLAGIYRSAATKKGPNGQPAHFANWGEVRTAYAPDFLAKIDSYDRDALGYWPASGGEIFWDVARGAMGAIADKVPNGMVGWQAAQDYLKQMTIHTGLAPDWNFDPTWDILPRTIH